MKANSIIGFYGKLPILGDFVSRQLPQEFITPWDGWLQSAISASQTELGEAWLDQYLTSPIWRFVLSSGLCGDEAWAGIVMPSVDKVGRYFPLTLAMPVRQAVDLSRLLSLGTAWFEQLEAAALTALEGDMTVSDFEQLLADIPLFSLPEQDEQTETCIGLTIPLENNAGYSLWTTADSDDTTVKLLAYQQLPPADNFSTFLKGDLPESNAVVVSQSDEPPVLNSLFDEPLDPLPWQSWAVTDQGLRRKHNEDAVLNRPEAGIWAVADGMGGHTAGDVASQLIVSSLEALAPVVEIEASLTEVQTCLQNINQQLRDLAHEKQGEQIIGSTVVVLLADPQRMAFVWAGDSRLYRLRDKTLQQLTRDHCAENDKSNIWQVKQVNVITRAIGANDELILDVEISQKQAGDVFLLCSDGLDKELNPIEIQQLMLSTPPKEIAHALLALSLQRGARDNVSIVVIVVV